MDPRGCRADAVARTATLLLHGLVDAAVKRGGNTTAGRASCTAVDIRDCITAIAVGADVVLLTDVFTVLVVVADDPDTLTPDPRCSSMNLLCSYFKQLFN